LSGGADTVVINRTSKLGRTNYYDDSRGSKFRTAALFTCCLGGVLLCASNFSSRGGGFLATGGSLALGGGSQGGRLNEEVASKPSGRGGFLAATGSFRLP